MNIGKRLRRFVVLLGSAAVAAGIVLFPAQEPVTVTARQILVGNPSPIYAVAYIDRGAPLLPALLFGSGLGEEAEKIVAERIDFKDPQMQDAQNQAWVAATFISSGRLPETWVELDPEGGVENVIACPQDEERMFVGCVSEKPYQPPGGLSALIKALRGVAAASSLSQENVEDTGAIEIAPVEISGRYGYPIPPAEPGLWTPVLDQTIPSIPAEGELGLWMGRSVGLAYALAYLDMLKGPIVPSDMIVAASGTITTSPLGEARVGSVVGLQQKAEGALRAGANVFFIPQGGAKNITDLDGIAVVEVSTPFEALKWLCENGSPAQVCNELYQQKK